MHALNHGIRSFTGVAETSWLKQILDFGWDCSLLGEPKRVGSSMLGALRIRIDEDTLGRLAASGVYAEPNDLLLASHAA